jgi:hypothetical protein
MITRWAIAVLNSAKHSIDIFDNLKKEQLREILLANLFLSLNYFLSSILKMSVQIGNKQ